MAPQTLKYRSKYPNPERWDIDDPKLYDAWITIRRDEADRTAARRTIDDEIIPFGIRKFKFTADDGFHLNGRRVQLYGVNLHHDHGPLGAAFFTRAMERQLEIMRDMGVNAIRTSHNAPAPELLDLCDRMGFVVWDECFDKWNETADRVDGKPSHEEHAKRHLRSLVMRDRNHPSVVVWSIGNEIPADREGVSPQRVKMMPDVVRRYDATRPVGLGCHIPEQVEHRHLRRPRPHRLELRPALRPLSRALSRQADHLQRVGLGPEHARLLRAAAADDQDGLLRPSTRSIRTTSTRRRGPTSPTPNSS